MRCFLRLAWSATILRLFRLRDISRSRTLHLCLDSAKELVALKLQPVLGQRYAMVSAETMGRGSKEH